MTNQESYNEGFKQGYCKACNEFNELGEEELKDIILAINNWGPFTKEYAERLSKPFKNLEVQQKF